MKNGGTNRSENNKGVKLDEIGYWSEIKHDIIKRYATEYSKILSNQEGLQHAYIDAFSGAGEHISRSTGELIPGSPRYALNISPPFKYYYFIDLDEKKTSHLQKLIGKRENVIIYTEDCNVVLLEKVLPAVKYEDYWRALCVLDPYGLHLDWKVVDTVRHMKSVEVFLNFPLHDINRSVVRKDPKILKQSNIERMDRFWGDRSWYDLLYGQDPDLFNGYREHRVASADPVLTRAYRDRLRTEAGFIFVPEPVLMRNKKGGKLYYLFFASHNETGRKIVQYIFDKYRTKGSL